VAGALFFYIMERDAAHRIVPVSNSQPLWGVLAAALLLGEEVELTILLSVALVILGSYFLTPKVGSGASGRWRTAMLLALLVGVMWGTTIALNKYCLSGGMSPEMFLLVAVGSASVACDLMWLVNRARNGVNFNGSGIRLSILSGILGLFVGQLLWEYALEIEEANALSPMVGAVIPLGFLFSILLLGERPTIRAWGGMAIIFAGVLLVLM
jgi:drug/metabolite transporter (DMT)-like permease